MSCENPAGVSYARVNNMTTLSLPFYSVSQALELNVDSKREQLITFLDNVCKLR